MKGGHDEESCEEVGSDSEEGESRQHVPLFLWSVTAAHPRREVSSISILSGFLRILDH